MSIVDRNLIRSVTFGLSSAALLASLCCAGAAQAQTPVPPPPTAAPAAEPAPAPTPEPSPADAPPAAEVPPPAAPPPPPPPPPLSAPPPPAPIDPGVHGERVKYDAPSTDVTSLTASGGAALNGGNTNSYQVNLGADFQLIRQPHGFAATAAFAYGVADIPDEEGSEDLEPIVRNLNAKARYDYFLSQLDAIFLATAFRWDPFAGIDRRNQGQIGYLRYLHRAEKHRFWGEIGYDLTSDDYRPVEGIPDAVEPDPEEDVIHSVRLFFGYENTLNASLTYLGGLEALMSVEDPEDTRINFANAIRSSISGNFALELKLTFGFDNIPATEQAEKLDTTVLINLIYQLL